MKKSIIISALCALLALAGFAQAPQAMKYQAVYRDSQGQPKANSPIDVVLAIRTAAADGAIAYQESHQAKTNSAGLFSLELGRGTKIGTAEFSSIDWSKGTYFLSVEADKTPLGTSQLLSVPYALYAADAQKVGGLSGTEIDLALAEMLTRLSAMEERIDAPKDTLLLSGKDGQIWKVWVDENGGIQTKKSAVNLIKIYAQGSTMYMPFLEEYQTIETSQNTFTIKKSDTYSQFYAIITAPGLYTEVMNISGFEQQQFTQTKVPASTAKTQGRIIIKSEAGYWIGKNMSLSVETANGTKTITSDEFGNYSTDIQGEISSREETFVKESLNKPYQDIYVTNLTICYKPNVYLYPEQKTQVSVKVSFPKGGSVITSIPAYNTGWNVSVEPSGLIDKKYGYLFYESIQPDMFQYKQGWVVEKSKLEAFYTENLKQYGFNKQEIADFIEYWIPRFTEFEQYAIYPQYQQDLDPAFALDISPRPDKLLRLTYIVQGVKGTAPSLGTPVIPAFTRSGFTATEWGVIIK